MRKTQVMFSTLLAGFLFCLLAGSTVLAQNDQKPPAKDKVRPSKAVAHFVATDAFPKIEGEDKHHPEKDNDKDKDKGRTVGQAVLHSTPARGNSRQPKEPLLFVKVGVEHLKANTTYEIIVGLANSVVCPTASGSCAFSSNAGGVLKVSFTTKASDDMEDDELIVKLNPTAVGNDLANIKYIAINQGQTELARATFTSKRRR